MGFEEMERVKGFFCSNGVFFEVKVHSAVRTSLEAARVRGSVLEEGVKSIVVRSVGVPGLFAVVSVPANLRVSFEKLGLVWGCGRVVLASVSEVFEVTGCEVGAVPPFGHKIVLPLFVDEKVFGGEFCEFNAGQRTVSVRVSSSGLKKVFSGLGAVFCSVSESR
jgi:prolyl-tRNA editing enzyme YbaK/EbsC (Cys-tRNA(Pro) deacylase)